MVTTSGTQTLTNKTIDADSNTHIISSNVEKVASDVNNIIIFLIDHSK